MLTAFSLLGLVVCAKAQDATDPKVEYIKKYSPIAVSEMKRTGVPASITLAQGLLESGAGNSRLATKANNHFGIRIGPEERSLTTMTLRESVLGHTIRRRSLLGTTPTS